MKGTIVELRGSEAAILTEDGQFLRILNRGYAVGETLALHELHPAAYRPRPKRLLRTAAARVLLGDREHALYLDRVAARLHAAAHRAPLAQDLAHELLSDAAVLERLGSDAAGRSGSAAMPSAKARNRPSAVRIWPSV